MSQNRSDTTFRSTRRPARELSTPQLRALRKELLIVRADVERMELAQATTELRQSLTHFSWLKFLVPGFAGMRRGASKNAGGGLGGLVRQFPMLSSLLSMVLAKPLRTSVVAGAKPALKWGSVALGVWEAWRIWQQIRKDRAPDTSAARAKGERLE